VANSQIFQNIIYMYVSTYSLISMLLGI
jgi:hypothetical protein